MKPALPRPVFMLVVNTKNGYDANENRHTLFTVFDAVSNGVNVVQVRNKTPDSSYCGQFRVVKKAAYPEAVLIANVGDFTENWTQAVGQGAVGVQFPESATTTIVQARINAKVHGVAEEILVGRSVHSVKAATAAAKDGFDYIVAGTIYPSNSHPGEPGQGVEYLRKVCAAVAPLPVIAIGGITPERVGECIAAGAAGVAVLSPIMLADDPQAVARTYREALDTAWNLRSTENR